jgi:hypothetical protein
VPVLARAGRCPQRWDGALTTRRNREGATKDVTAEGEQVIPALDDGLRLGARTAAH